MIDLRGGEGGRQAAGGRATYTLLLSSLSTNFAFGDSEETVDVVPQRLLDAHSPPMHSEGYLRAIGAVGESESGIRGPISGILSHLINSIHCTFSAAVRNAAELQFRTAFLHFTSN